MEFVLETKKLIDVFISLDRANGPVSHLLLPLQLQNKCYKLAVASIAF